MNIFKSTRLILILVLLLTSSLLYSQMIVRIDKGDEEMMDFLESQNLLLGFEMEDFIVVGLTSQKSELETRNIPFTVLSTDLKTEFLFIVSLGIRKPLEDRAYVGEIVINEVDFRVERTQTMPTEDTIIGGIPEGLKLIPVQVNEKVFYRNRKEYGIRNSEFGIPNSDFRSVLNNVSADSIAAYMQGLEDFYSRHALNANRFEVSQWIADQFTRFGYTTVEQDSFYATSWGGNSWQRNVSATIIGSEFPDTYVVVGAHHDSITNAQMTNPNAFAPGSNDNASGVAAVLELARVLKLHPGQPQYTIKFITFAKEEFGLHGAYHDANQMIAEGKNMIAMVNSDMISYSVSPTWHFRLIRYNGADALTNLALELGEELGLYMSTTTQWNQQSDSWAYHQVGVPSIFLHMGDEDPYYHTVNDLFTNQNMLYTEQYVKLKTYLVMTLALVTTYEHDIEATTISGLIGVPINTPTTYTIGVQNNGLNAADGYTVHLMEVGNPNPLASSPGVYIPFEESTTIDIEWIPTRLGETQLYGKVEWVLDEGHNNNESYRFPIKVLPEGVSEAYIGNKNSQTALTTSFINYNARNSITQSIYYENEVPFGFIHQMTVQFTGNPVHVFPGNKIDVYMSTTEKTSFNSNSDWIPFSLQDRFTLVFSGELDVFELGTYQVEIPIDPPFHYNQDNLVVMVVKENEVYYGSRNLFQFTHYTDQIRTIYWRTNIMGQPILEPLPTATGLHDGITNTLFSIYTFEIKPPKNLVANYNEEEKNVLLSWETPDVSVTGTFEKYKVFRDGVEIREVTDTFFIDDDIEYENEYAYWVVAVYKDPDVVSSPSNIVVVQTKIISDFEEPVLPIETRLLGNIPNPFNPETVILFSLAEESIVSIDIYNIRGQKVRNLINEHRESGFHQVVWNGTDETGRSMGSGIYFYQMTTQEHTETKRMVLLK